MNGGEIDQQALVESFSRIKQDISELNAEILMIKEQQHQMLKENQDLKKFSQDFIASIVRETLKTLNTETRNQKRNKILIITRISSLAEQKNLSLSEIKNIIMKECQCSKATFYRYIDKMKKRGIIDLVNINETDIVIKI